MKKRLSIALLIVATFVGVAAASFQHSWILHARLSLLLGGCLFCHVDPPTDSENLAAAHPKTFAAALVYKQGNYIGYLDRYGTFLGPTEPVLAGADRETKLWLALLLAEAISGAVIIGVAVPTIRNTLRRNSPITRATNS